MGQLPANGPHDALELIRRFKYLPKMMNGREVVVDFSIDRFTAVDAGECKALGLEAGATIRYYVTLSNGEWVYVYATGPLAERLLDLKGARVEVHAVTIYGVGEAVEWGDDGPITKVDEYRGLRIKEIRGIGPAQRESARQ